MSGRKLGIVWLRFIFQNFAVAAADLARLPISYKIIVVVHLVIPAQGCAN
jgi:hypothetical protein